MRKTIYLAYGSNLNVEQMKYRCPDAVKIGATVIENFKLNFRGTSRGSGVANIERCRGSRVPVGIWKISKSDEENLDMYEGYPHLYIKDYVCFSYGNKTYTGLVYIMRPGHPVMSPSVWYENTIRDGYDDFGIDTYALDEAVKRCTKPEDTRKKMYCTINGMVYSYYL